MCIYKSERKISKISFYHETLLTTSSSSFSFVNYLFLLEHKTQKKLQILIMKHIKTRFHYSLHSIFEHLFNSNLTSSIWHSFAHILLKHDTHDRFFYRVMALRSYVLRIGPKVDRSCTFIRWSPIKLDDRIEELKTNSNLFLATYDVVSSLFTSTIIASRHY